MTPPMNEWNATANRKVRRIVSGTVQLATRAQRWIALAAVVLLALILGSMAVEKVIRDVVSPYQEREQVWLAQVAAAEAFADSANTVAAARQQRIDKLEKDVAVLRGRIPRYDLTDSLRTRVDSLFHTLSDSVLNAYRVIPEQRVVILRQDTTIRVQRLVIAKQDTVIRTQDSTITDFRQVNDSLVRVLKAAPTTTKPVRLLGVFPAPSRRTSLLLGAVAGAVLVGTVGK